MRLKFIGSGSASNTAFGNASAVLEHNDKTLCIDYGFLTAGTFSEQYRRLPDAVFITHCHMDHAGGLEALFYQAKIQGADPIKIYVPVNIIKRLHEIFAANDDPWANEAVNFWEAFHLIPVSDSFFWEGLRFNVYGVRHHSPLTAYCLHLPGRFFFSGDTRPIPELISHYVNAGEPIFHDASRVPNPSHSGVDELIEQYRSDIVSRLHIYHHNQPKDVDYVLEKGLKAVRPNDEFQL